MTYLVNENESVVFLTENLKFLPKNFIFGVAKVRLKTL